MSSRLLYRGGNADLQAFPTHASYPIEAGDLCWVHTDGKAYPASACTTVLGDAGTAAQNRAQFAARFAGVAVQKNGLQTSETSFKLTTDKGYVLLAVKGDFEFECASTSWKPGDRVGVYNDATDSSDQKVAKVTVDNETIGVARVPYNALGAAQTTIIVSIRSATMLDAVDSGEGS